MVAESAEENPGAVDQIDEPVPTKKRRSRRGGKKRAKQVEMPLAAESVAAETEEVAEEIAAASDSLAKLAQDQQEALSHFRF